MSYPSALRDEDHNLAIQLSSIQEQFYTCPTRFSLFIGGIGSGKTTAGAARAVSCALDHPGSLGLVGAPTYTMLRDTSQRALLALLPPTNLLSFSKSEQHLILTNGSEILFRSLDEPDHVRGLNLAWFWLDEAPHCGNYAWQVLKGRLRQRGYEPAGWATGTPHGRDNYYRDFEAQPRPGHTLYRASTRTNLVNLPDGYLDELGYTGAFAEQEIEGIFTAFEGLVYAFDASVQGHLREPRSGIVWADVIGGVDWGYANPAAAVVFGLDGDARAWQLDEFYQRRASLEGVILPAILDLSRRYAVRHWYCGPDEPEHIAALAAALASAGVSARVLRADNAVRPGIQTITGLLAPRADGSRGLYIDPRCQHTIAEYGAYQYPTADPSRRDPSEQPLKRNDHCVGAGTPVMTSTGERAIETVQAGDLVLTRKGYRRVLAAGCTNPAVEVYCVEFSNGTQLVGTGNHRVWVVGRGWVPIDALRYRMHVETACIAEGALCQRTAMTSIQTRCASDVRSLSISTASRSVATPLIPATARGTIMGRGREIDRRATNRITGKSGSGANGPIPEGHHIHHIDGNPLNNRLENLECVPGEEHLLRYHSEWEPERVARQREWFDAIRAEAVAWHGTQEGRAWHSRHGKETWEGRKSKRFWCDNCGSEFQSRDGMPREYRYCSNKCRAAARRARHADDETRTCAWCGAEFRCNRYADMRFCSRSCAARDQHARQGPRFQSDGRG